MKLKYYTKKEILDGLHQGKTIYLEHEDGVEEDQYYEYYDLLQLPSGGHVPIPHLLEMGIEWKTLAKIPLGKPRGVDYYTCPGCGRKSFYAGFCCCECEEYIDPDALKKYKDSRDARKEREKSELQTIIENDDWQKCRYIRAVEDNEDEDEEGGKATHPIKILKRLDKKMNEKLRELYENVRTRMDEGQYDPDDLVSFGVDGYKTIFNWDDEENDLMYEVVSVDSFSISFVQAFDILKDDNSYATTAWEGRIVKKQRYENEEEEDADEPAYGGFSNTNGIPEMGELYIDQEVMNHANLKGE